MQLECPYGPGTHEAILDEDDDDDEDDPDDTEDRPFPKLIPARHKPPPGSGTEMAVQVVKELQTYNGTVDYPPNPVPTGATPKTWGGYPDEIPAPKTEPAKVPVTAIKIPGFGDLPMNPALFPQQVAILDPALVKSPAMAYEALAQMATEAAVKGFRNPNVQGVTQPGGEGLAMYPPPPKGYGGGAPLLEPALVRAIETVVASAVAEASDPEWTFPSVLGWFMAGAAGAAIAGAGGFFYNEWEKLNSELGGGSLAPGF